MLQYVVRRVLSVIPVLLVVSVTVFYIIHLTPGDPAAAMLGENATAEEVTELRERLGLNLPVTVQYLRWIGKVLQGDLGTSIVRGQSVTALIGHYIQPTLSLTIFSTVISITLALSLGILAAKRRGTLADQGVTVITLLGISLPSFLTGLGLMLLFSVKLRWFPVSGYRHISQGFLAHIHSLALPGIALGLMHSAFMMRMTRATMLEVLNSDFIKLAKAKGVREFSITVRHALRNGLIPLITIIGQGLIGSLSGAAVIESMFGIPGMGMLIVSSIGRRDYQMIQGIVLMVAVLNVGITLLVDLLYGVADPRIRLVSKS